MFKALSHAFYGDQTRWFIGKVVDNNDPLYLGRVRINILGIHDNVADAGDLPWASMVLPTTEGGVTSGFPPSLDLGAQVFGIFLDGVQSQLPLVIGSIPHKLSYNDPESGTFGVDRDRQGFIDTQPGAYAGITEPIGSANESAEKAYNYFRSVGYSDAVTRGIIGNMIVESGNFDPKNIGFDPGVRRDNGSMGVCQWRLGRLNGPKGLKAWAAQNNLNPENLSTQFQFTKFELDTFADLGKQELFNCTTPEQAAVTFCRKFENPAFEVGRPTSAYRDPPYSTTGGFPIQRSHENRRINAAKTIVFNSRSVTSSSGAV
jgi:hypothetical protein